MPERPPPPHDAPDGCEWIVAPAGPDWRPETGHGCRWMEGRPLRGCGRPSVMVMRRNTRWFHYCERHLYGRWIEGGQVMHWILRESGVTDA